MNPADLRKAIVEGNQREKLYRQSLNTVVRVISGDDIIVFSPNEKTAKEFMDAVKKRIEERLAL